MPYKVVNFSRSPRTAQKKKTERNLFIFAIMAHLHGLSELSRKKFVDKPESAGLV